MSQEGGNSYLVKIKEHFIYSPVQLISRAANIPGSEEVEGDKCHKVMIVDFF